MALHGRARKRRRRSRVLYVTGGSGFLGRHVTSGPEADNWSIVAASSAMLDVRNRDSVFDAFSEWKPTAVIHTAYRRDDRRSIVFASQNVAEAAQRCDARLIHVSTDVVFGGRDEPYTERDTPSPIHEYGRSKADAELAVMAACPGALVVRPSLLCGRDELAAHESVVIDALEGRSAVRFFTDEFRCPALVDDVAAALTQLADEPEVEGILHLGGPATMRRAELAAFVARRNGYDPDGLPLATVADSGLVRHANVLLDSSKARSMGFAMRGPADVM
jgi:dTDP-4-dehydrorhamnose reductase